MCQSTICIVPRSVRMTTSLLLLATDHQCALMGPTRDMQITWASSACPNVHLTGSCTGMAASLTLINDSTLMSAIWALITRSTCTSSPQTFYLIAAFSDVTSLFFDDSPVSKTSPRASDNASRLVLPTQTCCLAALGSNTTPTDPQLGQQVPPQREHSNKPAHAVVQLAQVSRYFTYVSSIATRPANTKGRLHQVGISHIVLDWALLESLIPAP